MKKNKFLLISLLFIYLPIFSEEIQFQAESMSGNAKNKNSVTILEGNAKVITETMEISADKIELSGKDFRIIKAYGNIIGSNKESKLDFSAGFMNYDRETKIAILENNVSLTDYENDIKAKAQIIEYDQEKEIAIMQINVSIVQKDNTCTAAYTIYKKSEKTLNMSGNPQIKQGRDTFNAQTISLNLDTQEIVLSGRVKGSVSSESTNSSNEKSNNVETQNIKKKVQANETDEMINEKE